MKKIFSIFILLGFIILNACDPVGDIYDEIDDAEIPAVADVEYTLTSDDYATILDAIMATNPSDSINGQFIAANEFFTDEISIQDYVPYFLNEEYPWLGPGSTAKITYNYNGDMPADLAMYAEASKYELDAADYTMVGALVGEVSYFFEGYSPDAFLPEILPDLITDAENGDLYRINYMYSDIVPVVPETPPVEVYSEEFTADLSAVDTFSIVGDDQKWEFDSYGSDTYAKMSGYSGGAQENEDWLVTPDITLGTGVNIFLNITQAINYLNDETEQIDILISTDYAGDVTTANWTSIKADINMPTGDSWTFVESGDVSLNDYEGETINIAFKYLSSSTNAATWEISEIQVTEGEKIIEGEPYELNDIYEFSNGMWEKASNVHYLNPKDYNAMGAPGSYDNFSDSELPQDYIPKYLDNMYPTAGDGQSAIVIYKYYAGTTMTLADEYTLTAGEWVSSYSYVQQQTGQFAVSANTELWVFDPTETYTMTSEDYQAVVEYVKANFADKDESTYDDSEYYYGASYYYDNFDLRNFNSEEFDDWEEAVADAISTIVLPDNYPNATVLVNGVQMYYKVVFATYSGAAGTYSMKFKVEEGPTFTFVEESTTLL
ncbi:MAG: DUF5017 domain-containing protein [Bacteroidetes bacterium]|nr:DUF5017 domain-containing protein [Bacteroidota bacterium]